MTVRLPRLSVRLSAAVLVASLSTGASAQVFRRPPEDALSALADRAKRRDKEAERQEKDWLKRRLDAGKRGSKAAKTRPEVADAYARAAEAYEQARRAIANERQFLRELIFAQQHPQNQPMPNVMALMDWVMPLPEPAIAQTPPQVAALQRLEHARRTGASRESIDAAAEEVEAHRQHALALGFLRNSLNDYLKVGGVASVEQRYERRLEARTHERAAWAARNANAEAELRLGGAVVLGWLSLGVLTAGLASLTAEGKKAAQAQLDSANAVVAATCAPPNIYVAPSATTPAFCVPR